MVSTSDADERSDVEESDESEEGEEGSGEEADEERYWREETEEARERMEAEGNDEDDDDDDCSSECSLSSSCHDEEEDEEENKDKKERGRKERDKRTREELEEDNERLVVENKKLRECIARFRGSSSSDEVSSRSGSSRDEAEEAVLDSVHASPPKDRPSVVLKQVFAHLNGRSLEEIAPPCRFGDVGAFPHAVANDPRTGLCQNQVESRRPVVFSFILRHEDGSLATERDVDSSAVVQFEGRLHYADTLEKVDISHFSKLNLESLCVPNEGNLRVKAMVNGMVSWSIQHFRIASIDTSPRNRGFVFRVSPLNPVLAKDPSLCFTSPVFVIRSKVTARRPAP